MKFKIKYADKIVGIFIIIGLLAIAVFLIFMGINQRWFAKNYYYNTVFLSADGLRAGMPIKYKGFQIGLINKVKLSKKNDVEVDFYIYGEYIDIITPNTIIQKSISPIGLGSDIFIHPGLNSEEHLPENSFIPSHNLPEAIALIDAGLVDFSQGDNIITNIIDQLMPVAANLSVLFDSIVYAQEDVPISNIIKNIENITAEIDKIFRNVNTISKNIADPDNSFTAITKDNGELYEQIDYVLTNLNNLLSELNDFTVYLNDSTPQITGVFEESRGALREGAAVMEGLKNNPLLRKGITQKKEQEGAQYNIREEKF